MGRGLPANLSVISARLFIDTEAGISRATPSLHPCPAEEESTIYLCAGLTMRHVMYLILPHRAAAPTRFSVMTATKLPTKCIMCSSWYWEKPLTLGPENNANLGIFSFKKNGLANISENRGTS